ncbi:MAG: FtsX-like permease family protein [Candidatus Thorarchaeota archaeon]
MSRMFLISRLISKSPQVLTTFIIFSLSAGVLGGILFYMDSTAPVVLGDLEGDIAYDMQISISSSFHSQNVTTQEYIENAILDQEYVDQIESLTLISTEYHYYEDDRYYGGRSTFLGVGPSFFETFPNAIEFDLNTSVLTDSTCYLEASYLEELNLEIGDNYTARVFSYDYETYQEIELNATYEIIGYFQSQLFAEYNYYYESWDATPISTLKMIITEDALQSDFEQLEYYEWNGKQTIIWVSIDTDTLLEGEITVVNENLDNLRKRIEQNTLPYAYVSDYGLQNSIIQYSSWVMSITGISVAFSIPSIVMGIMLVYYNSTLMSDERRKDTGTLKTRGASGWQAFNWILTSAILTGIIGSFGAVLTGAVSALLSGVVRTFLVFDFSQLSSFVLLLRPEAIIFVFAFSFGIGMMVALPVAVKAYMMSATEAHSVLDTDILLEQEEFGSPLVEILLILISGYLLFPMILLLGIMGSSSIMSIAFIAMVITLLGVFIIAFVRLVSRPASSIKSSMLGRIKSQSYIVGTRLISRTVRLHRKSEALGVMFIAMVFTAGIFSSVSATTGYNHMESTFKFQVGGDITLDVLDGLENVTTDLLTELSQVEGVAHTCAIYSFFGDVHYRSQQYDYSEDVIEPILIYAVQPDAWAEAGFWLPYFAKDTIPQDALHLMEEDPTNVLTSFKPVDHYISSGYSRVPVYSNEMEVILTNDGVLNKTDVTIVDVLSKDETEWSMNYLPGEPTLSQFLVMNLDYVHSFLETKEVSKFVISMESGANYTTVMDDIWEIAPYSFRSINSPFIYIDQALDSKGGQAIYGVYTLNVVFSLIYLTGGMLVVSSVRVRNLRKQFSVLRALGTDSKSIVVSMLLDASFGIILALGIGALLGLLLSVISINMPLVFTGVATFQLWNRLPVILAIPYSIIGGIIACAFIFTLVATYGVIRSALRKNIAEEIQYLE